ncbi:MAG: FHA domain-containing protein [Holophagaceae bacterium]
MAKLLVQESSGVREFELVDNEVHIGRELDNTLRLADPSISRHHCIIRRTTTGFEVQDLQSSNGVLLNGSRVQTAPIRDGDRITLGQMQLTFVDPDASVGATVAVHKDSVPDSPLGTLRMSAEQMAAMQGSLQAPSDPTPMPGAAPVTQLPPQPPPPPPPPPRPVDPPTTPIAAHDMPARAAAAPPPKVEPPKPPEFGHFTDPGAASRSPVHPSHAAPVAPPPPAGTAPHAVPAATMGGAPKAVGMLGKFLPPIPDDAQPTGERGDFVTRLIAALIDGAVMIPIVIVVIVLYVVMGILTRMVPAIGILGSCLVGLLYLGAFAGYFLYFIPKCVSKHGATIGKKMMKLRVVPEDNPYGRLSFGQALIRQLCHMLNFTIGYLLIFGAERKAVHDMITKTVVIKVDR